MARLPWGRGLKPMKAKKISYPFAAVKPKKPAEPPAPRRRDFENLLCQAISQGVTVEVRYDGKEGIDSHFREYGPTAVFYSSAGMDKICVSGEQLSNPNHTSSTIGPCTFEVGKIVDLRLTANPFRPDAGFDPSQARYRHGFVCKAV